MITGIGVDIIEIDRIKSAILKNQSFINRFFTAKEIEYLFDKDKVRFESVAGFFAAKEAVSKAMGTGFRNFKFLDIEIYKDNLGKPLVKLHNDAHNIANKNGSYRIHLSISHNKQSAVAYCIMEITDN